MSSIWLVFPSVARCPALYVQRTVYNAPLIDKLLDCPVQFIKSIHTEEYSVVKKLLCQHFQQSVFTFNLFMGCLKPFPYSIESLSAANVRAVLHT